MSEPARTISPPRAPRDGAAERSPDTDAPSPTTPVAEDGAEEQLDAEVQTLHDQVSERLRVLIESIEADLFDPLQSAAHEAAAIHEALVKTSHFDQPVDAIDPDLRWERVRDYRRDTMARVIEPLREQLLAAEIGATLNDRWNAFWDDLASLPTNLSVSVTRPEPAALYHPSAHDSVLTMLRKRWVQLRRRLPLNTQSPPSTAHTQDVPLRQLAAYHIRMRLPKQMAPHEQTVYQRFAHAVAAFERAVTTWTHRLLDAERHFSRPIDHLDDGERSALEDDPSSTASSSPPLPEEMPLGNVWKNVRSESETLNQQLHALASLDFDECPANLQAAVDQSWSALNTDINQADSFLVDLADRSISPDAPHDQRPTGTRSHWPTWYQQASDRLAFCRTLADLRDATNRQCGTLLEALQDITMRPLNTLHADAAQHLHALHEDAITLFDAPSSPDALAQSLRDIRTRAADIVEHDLLEAMHEARLVGATTEMLKTVPVPTDAFFDERPATFELHALTAPDASVITPEGDTRTVDLQTIAQEHFDPFFAEALRDALRPFQDALEAVLAEAKEIPRILQFNLDAAQDELDHASSTDDEAITAARELTLNGLARSAEAVEMNQNRAHDAMSLLVPPMAAAYLQAWVDLHDRARVESRIREHLLELRTLVSRETQEATERAERRFRAARIRFKRALRLGRWRAEELVQRGRSAVGAAAISDDTFLETIETLARADHMLEGLPLVYRRLFARRALTDPSLLAGRQNDLLRMQRHIEQWQRGLTNAIVVTGHHGSGLTSFLNVVQRTSLQHGTVHWASLDERLRSESDIAEQLVHALRLSIDHPDDALTLDHVREHLLAQPRTNTPRVCFVEHLEHLYLRTVHGTKLADRVLTFMSRTDSRILWIGTMSNQGWQLLDRSASAVSGLVLHHALAPLDRTALETLILARHQRSGLQLQFDPPDEPSPLLRQRLRKADTDEAEQSILRTHYFDRLHMQCGSNIVLALFYWIRSVHLDDEELVMHVRPAKDLSFGFLERFSMQQAFVLQSLLDHGSLTIEEYSEVSQLPVDTCLELFESLGNALLIEPTASSSPHDADSLFITVEPSQRYRIRPLVIHPVMEFLRSKNILH